MRAVVAGGAGFVGRHVVQRLLQDGADVVTVDFVEPDAFPGEAFVSCDLTDLDATQQRAAMLDDVGALVWLPATIRQSAVVDERAQADVTLMVEAPLRFLRGLRRPPASVAYLSSIQVYGRPHSLPVDEQQATNPFTAYGVAKLCGEQYLAVAGAAVGTAVANLRAAFVYGPGQHDANVIPRFLSAVRDGKPPQIHGTGSDTRDDVHVADVAAAVSKAVAGRAAGAFNVASGRPHTLRDVAETICSLSSAGLKPEYDGQASTWVDRWYSVDRARATFGWEPEVPFDAGIREMWERM